MGHAQIGYRKLSRLNGVENWAVPSGNWDAIKAFLIRRAKNHSSDTKIIIIITSNLRWWIRLWCYRASLIHYANSEHFIVRRVPRQKKVSFSRNSFRFFMAFHSVANELWLALWAAHKKARMKSDFRIVIKFNFHACLHNFSYLLPFHCSKKKLIQQRSHQTTDRPIIPNILMMPTSKTVEKIDQYVVEWVLNNSRNSFFVRKKEFKLIYDHENILL